MDETRVELGLRDFVRVLRRRRGLVALTVLVVVGVAVVASLLQTPVYAGRARVLLQSRNSESLFDPGTGVRADPNRAAQTEIEVIESEPVRAAVRKQLGAAPEISAQTVREADVIEVRAESTDPKRARDVVNAYVRAYLDYRRQQAVDDVLAAAEQLQGKLDGLQTQLDELDAKVANAPASQQAAVREDLASRKAAVIGQQSLFKQKLDELQVDAALKTGGSQLLSPAATPSAPVRPRPVRSAVLAAAVGLFFGCGLVFLVEYLDDSVKTKDDLARVAPYTPVIGLIPNVDDWLPGDTPRVVSISDPRGPAAEAYRTLRTSLQFVSLERQVRTLLVTSPNAEEGKSTTLANLGVALARAGQRVLILCCDLRRPRIHEFFGLDNSVGFTSVLLGKVPLAGALQAVPGQGRLLLLPSGPLPPNPSELLASKRTVELLTSLQNEADIVLVDAPPVLPVTDALVLSGRMDATLLVCLAGFTTRTDAARALELLGQVGAPLVGTVLNGVARDAGYGYAYGYNATVPGGDGAGTPAPPSTAAEALRRR